ncbi:MAG: hypothetical protein IKU54_02515 [Oscillospiraceae bacterium]|nr:hypothetical protein [Oscillospiraceae bacterium]
MKILFINLPYYGHVVPTIGLVQELIRKGCEVTYLMPYDWKDRIEESGAGFIGYKNHSQLAEQIKNAYAAAEKIIDEFDIIVYEQFFFLGKHLAEKHNKPVVRIFTAPVTNRKMMEEFIRSGPLRIFKNKWINKAFTKDIAKNIPLKTDNWLDEIIYNPPDLNLVYTLRQYQPYEDEFSDKLYRFIGPSVYNRKSQAFDFKKGNNPVIYISFGTIIKEARTFFRTCVETFRNENYDVIISCGDRFDTGRIKNIPSNIHFYSSVPQIDVLKMADVFVTHGGMNSVSEALVSGTPMVIIPFASDQPVNARTMEKLGVATVLDSSSVEKESLKSAVEHVINNDVIRKNISNIQNFIKASPGNNGGADMIIDYFNNLYEIENDL